MVKLKILIPIIFLSLFAEAFAQTTNDSTEAYTEFNLALDLYNSSQYGEAQKIFSEVALDYQFNPRTTLAYLFDGKSLLALKNYSEAEKVLKNFLQEYPTSKYSDEARATLAETYYEKGDKYSAFKELTKVIEKTNSPVYSSYAKTTDEKISDAFLSIRQLESLYDSTSNQKLKPYLMLLIGKKYTRSTAYNKAENIFAKLLKEYPNSEEKSEAATIYQHIKNEEKINPSSPIIGVMLPLSHVNKNAANAASEILEGIKYALDSYNKVNSLKIGLLIRDTERDSTKIEQIKNDFENVPSLKAVIGPLFSDEVTYTLKDFKNSNIPIISPTATENGLTDLYPDFFQANPSFDIRGKVMADYIFFVENKRKMAVFNSEDGYSPILAKAFVNEFQKLGGQILIQQNYNSNSTEYNEQLTKIAADSLIVQGVYLPLADKRDVPVLLSNFAQFNLDLPIYGNQDWFMAKGFETYPSLSNKLTFTSDYFIDYTNSTLQSFSKGFYAQTNIDVDRNVLYGYDLMNYLLKVIPNSTDRQSVIENLESGTIYKGLHNNFYFDKSRINKFINILRYKDGQFQLVDKFKTGN